MRKCKLSLVVVLAVFVLVCHASASKSQGEVVEYEFEGTITDISNINNSFGTTTGGSIGNTILFVLTADLPATSDFVIGGVEHIFTDPGATLSVTTPGYFDTASGAGLLYAQFRSPPTADVLYIRGVTLDSGNAGVSSMGVVFEPVDTFFSGAASDAQFLVSAASINAATPTPGNPNVIIGFAGGGRFYGIQLYLFVCKLPRS